MVTKLVVPQEMHRSAIPAQARTWSATCSVQLHALRPHPLIERVLGAAIEVHRTVGPGLLESTYQSCLEHEFGLRGIGYERQSAIEVIYKGTPMNCGYRADFIVEREILLELKRVDQLAPIHHAQTLAYLRLLKLRHALLINFNAVRLVDGLKSFVL